MVVHCGVVLPFLVGLGVDRKVPRIWPGRGWSNNLLGLRHVANLSSFELPTGGEGKQKRGGAAD